MSMTLGNETGFAEPGVVGYTNPFPYENLSSIVYKRLAKNRIAGLGNKTCDFELNSNDVVAAHRAVYTGRQAARNARLLAAYAPSAGIAYANAEVPSNPRAGTGTILEGTGKAIASPGDLTRIKSLSVSSAVGVVSVNPGVGRGNDIFAQWLTMNDSDLTTVTKYVARVTDASNWIGAYRQAATTIRVERNVAAVLTTELDITVPATTPVSGNALGLRLSGTTCGVFLNGTKLADIALSAAAQGLAGTLAGVVLAAGANVYSVLDYMEVWSTTPVLGI